MNTMTQQLETITPAIQEELQKNETTASNKSTEIARTQVLSAWELSQHFQEEFSPEDTAEIEEYNNLLIHGEHSNTALCQNLKYEVVHNKIHGDVPEMDMARLFPKGNGLYVRNSKSYNKVGRTFGVETKEDRKRFFETQLDELKRSFAVSYGNELLDVHPAEPFEGYRVYTFRVKNPNFKDKCLWMARSVVEGKLNASTYRCPVNYNKETGSFCDMVRVTFEKAPLPTSLYTVVIDGSEGNLVYSHAGIYTYPVIKSDVDEYKRVYVFPELVLCLGYKGFKRS